MPRNIARPMRLAELACFALRRDVRAAFYGPAIAGVLAHCREQLRLLVARILN